jgi:hypothetical protein
VRSWNCDVRVFDTGDNRGAFDAGDWDVNHHKGECRNNEFIAGVSVDPVSYQPHSLLCCTL